MAKVKYVDELKEIIKKNNSLDVKLEDKHRQMLKEFLKNEFVIDLKTKTTIFFNPSLIGYCLWDKDKDIFCMKKCFYYGVVEWLKSNGFSAELFASQIEKLDTNNVVKLTVEMV